MQDVPETQITEKRKKDVFKNTVTKNNKKVGRPRGSGSNVIWKPQKMQTAALVRIEFEILYGGARGGGKTDAGMAWMLYEKDNPLFRGLVIRLNAKDLEDWIDRAQRMYAGTGAVFSGKPTQIKFPSGAIIRTGHLKDENAFNQFKGHEYQRILIEELTQIAADEKGNPKNYEQLISSCRSTEPSIKPQIFCTTNPDGIGHDWVKKRWNIPDEPTGDIVVTDTDFGGRVFVPSTVYDNPKLMEVDTNYVKQLEAISDENLRNAWLRGNWGDPIIEGAVYRPEIEEMKAAGRYTFIVYDKRYPVHTYWDLGFNDSTVIGFFQKIGNRWNMIDYYTNKGYGLSHYVDVIGKRGYEYGQHFAPHDINQTDWATGETRQKIASDLGLYFYALEKLPIEDGINAMRMKFNRLYVDKTKCAESIETLLAYHFEYDEDMKQYKNKPFHDWSSHCADMFRTWAMAPEPVSGTELQAEFNLLDKNYS